MQPSLMDVNPEASPMAFTNLINTYLGVRHIEVYMSLLDKVASLKI